MHYIVSASVLKEISVKQLDFIKEISNKYQINSDDLYQIFDFEKKDGEMCLHFSIDDMYSKETIIVPTDEASYFTENVFFVSGDNTNREIAFAH